MNEDTRHKLAREWAKEERMMKRLSYGPLIIVLCWVVYFFFEIWYLILKYK